MGSISCPQTFLPSTDLDSKGQGKDFPFYLGSLSDFASGQCLPWCSFQCMSINSSYYLHILHQSQYLISYDLSIIHTAYPVNASTFLPGQPILTSTFLALLLVFFRSHRRSLFSPAGLFPCHFFLHTKVNHLLCKKISPAL